VQVRKQRFSRRRKRNARREIPAKRQKRSKWLLVSKVSQAGEPRFETAPIVATYMARIHTFVSWNAAPPKGATKSARTFVLVSSPHASRNKFD
jgi:hypothetical protein